MWQCEWVEGDFPVPNDEALYRQEALRHLYGIKKIGPEGLSYLLAQNAFFRGNQNESDMAKSNSMKIMLSHMGIWVPGNELLITQALLSIPPVHIDVIKTERRD